MLLFGKKAEKKKKKKKEFSLTLSLSLSHPFTLYFSLDRSVNEDSLVNYIKYLIKIGVRGAYVHGTTGEGVTLSHEEKKSLTRAWIKVVKENNLDLLVVINVSSCSINDVLDHAKLCQEIDADAIAFLPPFYYRPNNAAQLAKYITTISQAVPKVPTFYYHFPEMSGVRIAPSQWLPLVSGQVKNFTAVKFTDKDMTELAKILTHHSEKVKVYPGYEDTILTAAALGAEAFIGAMYNLSEGVNLNHEIVDAVTKGDLKTAREKQVTFVKELEDILAGPGLINNLKKNMSKIDQVDFFVGSARPPLDYK